MYPQHSTMFESKTKIVLSCPELSASFGGTSKLVEGARRRLAALSIHRTHSYWLLNSIKTKNSAQYFKQIVKKKPVSVGTFHWQLLMLASEPVRNLCGDRPRASCMPSWKQIHKPRDSVATKYTPHQNNIFEIHKNSHLAFQLILADANFSISTPLSTKKNIPFK